jgi:hypothetical protein
MEDLSVSTGTLLQIKQGAWRKDPVQDPNDGGKQWQDRHYDE